jgi:hypothetical protein
MNLAATPCFIGCSAAATTMRAFYSDRALIFFSCSSLKNLDGEFLTPHARCEASTRSHILFIVV